MSNGLSGDEFQSVCLSNGKTRGLQYGPICMGINLNPFWALDIPIHDEYDDGGLTQRGADFLYPLAQRHRTF